MNGEFTHDGSQVNVREEEALRTTLEAGVLANEAAIERREGRASEHAAQATNGGDNGQEALEGGGDEFEVRGDPTEVAMLVAAAKAGIDRDELTAEYEVWDEIPFDSDRKYSAVFCRQGDRNVAFVKGAPEVILERAESFAGDGRFDKDEVSGRAEEMASQGLRVLACAYRELPEDADEAEEGLVAQLTFAGFQGMIDPPRAEVKDAIAKAHGAGVRVLMITGDHSTTAAAIGGELGISRGQQGEVITGRELRDLSDQELDDRLDHTNVFARVAPEQKLRLVRALQRRGNVVAVTGDGVNDAPALKAADVGVAMGQSGTDVAKEAAEIVIVDDNFASIYAAIEEGRYSFGNVRKVTFFLLSSGVAEVIAIMASIFFGFPAPFLPAQILWLNLVTNGIQDVALAFEPGEEEVMKDPPRPQREGLLSSMYYERLVIAGVWLAAGTLLLFLLEIHAGTETAKAQTIALTTMVMFKAFHVYNCRSDYQSVFRRSPLTNRFLLAGSVVALAIHIAALYTAPGQFVLRVEPLDLVDWLKILGVSSTILVVMDLHKLYRRRLREGQDGTDAASAAVSR